MKKHTIREINGRLHLCDTDFHDSNPGDTVFNTFTKKYETIARVAGSFVYTTEYGASNPAPCVRDHGMVSINATWLRPGDEVFYSEVLMGVEQEKQVWTVKNRKDGSFY